MVPFNKIYANICRLFRYFIDKKIIKLAVLPYYVPGRDSRRTPTFHLIGYISAHLLVFVNKLDMYHLLF